MKINEFSAYYDMAKKTIIHESDFFNCAGWFWINLSEKQHKKMYQLMLSQGAKEETDTKTNRTYIQIQNGLQINRI